MKDDFDVESDRYAPQGYDGSSAFYFMIYKTPPIDIENLECPIEYVLDKEKERENSGHAMFWPPHYTPRIKAQSGVLTIQHDPAKPWFYGSRLVKYLIPHEVRREFRKILNSYGVNDSSMFPDLDGLASHLKNIREDHYCSWERE